MITFAVNPIAPHRQQLTLITIVIIVLCLAGCTPATTVPLSTLQYGTMDARQHKNLLVLLRGIGGSHKDFETLGAIKMIRRLQLPFDVVAPDTHFGYYKERSVVERLHHDVIAPAKRQGYQQIWLAGFSMGGLGSLFYLRERADEVNGVMLISPFLGWDPIIHEIKEAGGLALWQPKPEADPDWEHMLWSWLKTYPQQSREVPVYLGYGRNDLIADEGPPLLATILDPQHSFNVSGGHTNNVMLKIFYRLLRRLSPELLALRSEQPQTTVKAQTAAPPDYP